MARLLEKLAAFSSSGKLSVKVWRHDTHILHVNQVFGCIATASWLINVGP
jgi:hypothetical protein